MATTQGFNEVEGTVAHVFPKLDALATHSLVELEEATLTYADGVSSRRATFLLPITPLEHDAFKASLIPGAKLHARIRKSQILPYAWELDYLINLVSEVTGPIDYQLIAEIVRSR